MIAVLVFVQTWRASIIPLLVLPMSLVGTFSTMLGLEFSLNTLSMFGLVLGIGIVEDDWVPILGKS
jgi:multidrug efflux pump subunit AcrB